MSNLIRLMYISRATFKPTPAIQGIEPHVARILQSSRINNAKIDVGGVLFYGNGHFFQCLEGDIIESNDPKRKSRKVTSRADKERSGWITMGIIALILIAGGVLLTQLL